MKHQLFIDSEGKTVRHKSPSFNSGMALAAAMMAPIRRRLDYQGLAQKVFQIQPLPIGALPTHDTDIDISASLNLDASSFKHDQLKINSKGKVEKNFGRVFMPKFEIYSNPTISITDVKRRRFNLIDRPASGLRINSKGKTVYNRRRRFAAIDRAVQKARQEIMAREDAEIFKALDAITVEPENKKELFWCEGCGEPRYKCYCDEGCPYCDKKLKDCTGESDTGYCDNDTRPFILELKKKLDSGNNQE